MKIYTKLLLLALCVMVFVLPLVIKGPGGKSLMALGDWLPAGKAFFGGIDKVKQLTAGDESSPRLSADSGKMYKWQDEKGAWHFSQEKPLDTESATIEDLSELENVMEAPVVETSNSSTIALPGGFSLD